MNKTMDVIERNANHGLSIDESDLFQASNKWMQHWKSQASDDSTWARIQRQSVNSRHCMRHGMQSSQVLELFVTVSVCFNIFKIFQRFLSQSEFVQTNVGVSRVSSLQQPARLKLSLFHPGLVSLSVRAVSKQSDGLWIGRAGFREPPTLFYAEARF